jgi:hypothetical protein
MDSKVTARSISGVEGPGAKRSSSKLPGPAGFCWMNLLREARRATNLEAHQPTMAKMKTKTTETMRIVTSVLMSSPVPIETGGGGPVLDRKGGMPGGSPDGERGVGEANGASEGSVALAGVWNGSVALAGAWNGSVAFGDGASRGSVKLGGGAKTGSRMGSEALGARRDGGIEGGSTGSKAGSAIGSTTGGSLGGTSGSGVLDKGASGAGDDRGSEGTTAGSSTRGTRDGTSALGTSTGTSAGWGGDSACGALTGVAVGTTDTGTDSSAGSSRAHEWHGKARHENTKTVSYM